MFLEDFEIDDGSAPIFDNGDAFFSSYAKFEPWLSVHECIESSVAAPFSGSFDQQFHCVENKLKVNYARLLPRIETVADCRCKEAALALLCRYEAIFRDDTLLILPAQP